jgi:hypothetical protein
MLDRHDADGRRWAVDTLREVADRLEDAPRGQPIEAMPRIAGTIDAAARDANRILPRRRWWTELRAGWAARRSDE